MIGNLLSKLFRKDLSALAVLTGLVFNSLFSQTSTISGNVKDEESGETLIGASVFAPALGSGATTNEYGFYSLTLPSGNDSILLEYSYVGFQTRSLKILPKKDQSLNVRLGTGIQLQEVVVKANSYEEQIRST